MGTARTSMFRQSALLSGMLKQEQIDRVEASLRAALSDVAGRLVGVSDEQLAQRLVELDVLTSYQADQLLSGRTKLNLGPYIITDWIGQGGMGQVFKAVHEVMGRVSAVKVLPLSKTTPDSIANFSREIRMQAQLDHPNLVRAYDAGHDGNVHYLVTEYVPGTDLRRLVRAQGPLTMQQAARIGMQAALGLDYAHRRGLIHRDVKPGNILVTPEGVAKVSDLGLSGFTHEGEEDPRSGKVVGTADYLPPEKIKNPRAVTSVSDIYSLGCTLYYSVTGKVPFPGGSMADKARRHLEEYPWHPRRFNPEISEEFVEIIADMMEKEPSERIQSAGEVAARLEPWAVQTSELPAQRLAKKSWHAPPLPTGLEEDLQETDADVVLPEAEGKSQSSQTTDPLASALEGTVSARNQPPLRVNAAAPQRTIRLVTALAIAIPTALLIGFLLGFLIRGAL